MSVRNGLLALLAEQGASVVVVGPDMAELSTAAAALVGAENVVVQREQLGTANAVDAAREVMKGADGHAIVLYADTPLVPKEAGERAFAEVEKGASVCVLGFKAKLPNRYGRLVTGTDGSLEAIVEAKDASEAQLAIELANSGVMVAPAKLMFELLGEVKNDNAKKEYYLTDLVKLARGRGLKAGIAQCKERDVQGVNSQVELAQVERVFQDQMRDRMMEAGVTLLAPETVFFSYDTVVGAGATIELASDEQIKLTFLHDVFFGRRTDVPRRRHHRLPVSVSVRYRITNSASYVDCAVSEIGVGGALLTTPEPLRFNLYVDGYPATYAVVFSSGR